MPGGRAGAEPELHARPHPFQGAGGGLTFQRFDVHECSGRLVPMARLSSHVPPARIVENMPGLIVVFDLDGTLIDTAPDLVDTLNTVFAREGLPPVPYAKARTMIGGGAKRMIELGLKAEGRNVGSAELDRMFAEFLVHYSTH